MAVVEISEPIQFKRVYICLTADVKPTGVRSGSICYEVKVDTTVDTYITPDGTNWNKVN
jgi:hypothetical protein